jgi:uncharacterized protein (TIGR02757 family)
MRMDPVEYVHAVSGKANRELAGLLASSLAYGRVETIRANIQELFAITGNDLCSFVDTVPYTEKRRMLFGFKHRFNDGADMALLCESLRNARAEYGSLEALFVSGIQLGDMHGTLTAFTGSLRSYAQHSAGQIASSFAYLLPRPENGSACKRLNMFLRWMVRRNDGIDLGLWTEVDPCMLIMPVDTHVAAVARTLMLTARKTVDWRMAEEITAALKKINPSDPVKYDFSLCRAGMIDFRTA